MKYIKRYEHIENEESSWIINIDDIINVKLCKTLPDISDNVKVGDIVIGVWFDDGFTSYLLKVDKLDDDDDGKEMFGACDNDTCYSLDMALDVFDYNEYTELDPQFEMKLQTRKFNI